MGDYIITTNPDRCIACHSCEVACKSENKVPLDATLGKIVVLGPKMVDNVPRMSSVFVPAKVSLPYCRFPRVSIYFYCLILNLVIILIQCPINNESKPFKIL